MEQKANATKASSVQFNDIILYNEEEEKKTNQMHLVCKFMHCSDSESRDWTEQQRISKKKPMKWK